MQTFESYRLIDYIRSVDTSGRLRVDFHLHEGCEIYFLISGDIEYFVEKKIYPVKYGDLFLTNNQEIHKPNFLSNAKYERITINFSPSYIASFSTPDFDLLHCFINRPKGEQNKLSLTARQTEHIMDLFMHIEQACVGGQPGGEIQKLGYFLEVLVYINRIFLQSSSEAPSLDLSEQLISILDFIDDNLEEDLSLNRLEKHFYINRFYLNRIFKKTTGSTLHDYIIYKRISRAKTLLSEGVNPTECCYKCGFNDYSNFCRMFKRVVGMPPRNYRNNCLTLRTIE